MAFFPFCYRCLCFTSKKHKALIFPDFRHGVLGQCQFASLWQLTREEYPAEADHVYVEIKKEKKKAQKKKSKATEGKCEMATVHVL